MVEKPSFRVTAEPEAAAEEPVEAAVEAVEAAVLVLAEEPPHAARAPAAPRMPAAFRTAGNAVFHSSFSFAFKMLHVVGGLPCQRPLLMAPL